MVSGLVGMLEQASDGAQVQEQIGNLKKSVKQGDVKKASQDFEAYFMSYMLKKMRETVPKSTLTQNRMGEVYHSFYDEEIAKQSVQAGGIGLAQYIETRLRADQEDLVDPNKKGSSS